MGRELRKVPATWKHPQNGVYSNGETRYVALIDGARFQHAAEQWDMENAKWNNGEYPDYADEGDKRLSYADWAGERPNPENYMPAWTEEEKTHYMLYETTSEGTPESPAFDNIENLARWLSDNNATTFGRETTTYENWLAFCKAGSGSIGFAITGNDGFVSGVDLVAQQFTKGDPS